MKTTKKYTQKKGIANLLFKGIASLLLVMMFTAFSASQAFAHCDSYDGPVIKDALKAFKQNNVSLVLKWVNAEHEQEIKSLFDKTLKIKKTADKEISQIIETHFLETLVRLHREGEGEPYTGLKPAGSVTPVIQMADASIENKSADVLVTKLKAHIEKDIKEKYQLVQELSKTKDESLEKGRAYVAAYVNYTHTLEGLEAALKGHEGHSAEKH
jgi:hypothetical protein